MAEIQEIRETARRVPVVADADVVVAGGGPGGLPAAIAAARHGARVVLIERFGYLGGLATAGLVAPILGHTASNSRKPIVEGILKELTERMHDLGGAPSWHDACEEWGIRFDAETFKYVADVLTADAGLCLYLHSLVTDVIVEDRRIVAFVMENKSGRQAVTGKVFVDATGDADAAFRAGVRTRQGREYDERVQSMGSFLHIGGVSHLSDRQRKDAEERVGQAMEKGELNFYAARFTGMNTIYADHFSPNMTRWSGDPTNVVDLTRAEVDVRREGWKLILFLRANVPGCENVYIRHSSPVVGPRESRQAIGRYIIAAEDIHQGRKFEDAIARGSWWIDIHCPLGNTYPVHLCIRECPKQDECPFWRSENEKTMLSGEQLYPPKNDWYDIPYRSITPVGIENLLMAGRSISASHQAMAATRVMGTCIAIGQAAGTAAALAAEKQIPPQDIDVSLLRDILKADGALV